MKTGTRLCSHTLVSTPEACVLRQGVSGAAGHDICFIHPKGNERFPIGGEGALAELVQAPPEVIEAYAKSNPSPLTRT